MACLVICLCTVRLLAQSVPEDSLSGPDKHELPDTAKGHLLGDWAGGRSMLLEHGVKCDLHSISDNLFNVKSTESERLASYNRTRGTIDIDLGKLVAARGFSFHITAAWQTGANLQTYLGLIATPSSLASSNAFRLDSWWFQKQWFKGRIAARIGQFAGEDTYGNQEFGNSFVFEPMGGPTDNLFNTFESFDPPSTPAFELHVVPVDHFYIRSAVLSVDRMPYANNQTGLVPQFHGPPVSVSEIGLTPGQNASGIAPADDAASRKGYQGVYRFGVAYNPGKFTAPNDGPARSGNYLLYGIASQALWRRDSKQAKGVDATFTTDWGPPGTNLNYGNLTAGLRLNEPLPSKIHNTMSLGYVRNALSSQFLAPAAPAWKAEQGAEFNILLNVRPSIVFQPVVQYYENAGGGPHGAVVIGFRTKVEY